MFFVENHAYMPSLRRFWALLAEVIVTFYDGILSLLWWHNLCVNWSVIFREPTICYHRKFSPCLGCVGCITMYWNRTATWRASTLCQFGNMHYTLLYMGQTSWACKTLCMFLWNWNLSPQILRLVINPHNPPVKARYGACIVKWRSNMMLKHCFNKSIAMFY